MIETPRLVLRGRRAQDFPAFADILADAAYQRFIAKRPLTEEEALGKFLRMSGHWRIFGYGFWLIEHRDTGRVIGEAGYAEFRRTLIPAPPPGPEVGWGIAPAAQRHGYAREAVAAVVAWGDANLASRTSFCLVDPENEASLRTAARAGFAPRGVATYRGEPIVTLARHAPGAGKR